MKTSAYISCREEQAEKVEQGGKSNLNTVNAEWQSELCTSFLFSEDKDDPAA